MSADTATTADMSDHELRALVEWAYGAFVERERRRTYAEATDTLDQFRYFFGKALGKENPNDAPSGGIPEHWAYLGVPPSLRAER
jgi:hypothetical protein